MTDNYFVSARGLKIDHARAMQELKTHGVIDTDEFLREVKPDAHGEYSATAVLRWLGY